MAAAGSVESFWWRLPRISFRMIFKIKTNRCEFLQRLTSAPLGEFNSLGVLDKQSAVNVKSRIISVYFSSEQKVLVLSG